MTNWYVVQVFTGMEEKVKQLILTLDSENLLEECIVPRSRLMKKFHGEWKACDELLLPGYLFVVTSDIAALESELRTVPAYTKLLGSNDRFIPLEKDDIVWLESLTSKNHRTIMPSNGVRAGDEVFIQEGPLQGMTGMIAGINGKKRLAFLEMKMLGRTVRIKVSLHIISKS